MKILFCSQYFPPEPGAPAARVSELTRAWVAAGHDVTVLTAFPHHPTGIIPTEYRGKSLVREDYFGVRVVRTWIYAAPNKGKIKRSLAYASFAVSATSFGQFFAETPDVVVATSPQLLCAVAGRAVAFSRRCPFVFEVRDLWPESVVAVGALPARHPIVSGLEVIEQSLYSAAAKIVVVTDTFRQKLTARGISASKIDVIKNGVDLKRFVPRGDETALRMQLGHEKFIVSYVGTHGMAHGLDAVLDAAKLLKHNPRVHFLFVGEGAERARLQARVLDEAISNVTMMGVLPRERMPEVYATSNLCLVPLRNAELFTSVIPSKIFEIAAMERPIVLSVDGEARVLVEASNGGVYVPPEDSLAMARAIEQLASAPSKLAAMGKSARAFVVREFDRDVLAKRYLGILEQVASSS